MREKSNASPSAWVDLLITSIEVVQHVNSSSVDKNLYCKMELCNSAKDAGAGKAEEYDACMADVLATGELALAKLH